MSTSGTFLVVDDERAFRVNVSLHLRSRGFSVLEAENAEAAMVLAQEHRVDVALIDMVMPDVNGIELLGRLKEENPFLEAIIVTGKGSIESAVEAMRRGAFSYITKPFKLCELEVVAARALEKAQLARRFRDLQEDLRRRQSKTLAAPVFKSAAMQKLYGEASQVARNDLSVLIEGETGVGKEVLAEYIHQQSARREGPFSVLNTGALSESLLDSELFGYERGAFTGAAASHPGMIEITDGGTLLLDEIGDIPESAQIRLLRFLDRGVLRRIGATREKSVNVRILAATYRNIDALVTAGKFRQDLYHRLVTVRLRVPPLRERPEDILPLAQFFLGPLPSALGGPAKLSHEAEQALMNYPWPGNIRELKHTMERVHFAAQVHGRGDITAQLLNLPACKTEDGRGLLLKDAVRGHIAKALERFGGNRQKAAEALGISERYLYKLLADKGGEQPESGADGSGTSVQVP